MKTIAIASALILLAACSVGARTVNQASSHPPRAALSRELANTTTVILSAAHDPVGQSTDSTNGLSPARHAPRMLKSGDVLAEAYFGTYQSIETAEEFMRKHPDERDLCAGALLNIAALYARQNKREEAIASYQEAIDEYGEEIVPDKSATFTVTNWALFRIGQLERETGNRDRALEIFGNLMTSADFNTRTSSRIEYLATKQSHLRLKATVSLPKERFSKGEEIPVCVVVQNSEKETATFQCFVRIRQREGKSYGAIAPRSEAREIVLQPDEEFKDTFVFNSKDGLNPETWEIDCGLNGIPFGTNSLIVQIVEK